MAADRKEPTITIVPDRDEIATHQQRILKENNQRARPQTAAIGATRPPEPVTKVVRSPLAPFAFLLALTGLGLAGFVYWQFLESQKQLAQAGSRIEELENRLALSDDESSQSVTALQVKLKEVDSEIRKLWGVSYDRNRKAIETMQKSLLNVESAIKSVSGDAKQALATASAQKAALDNLRQRETDNQKRVNNLATGVKEQQLQTQAVVDLANRLEQQVSAMQTDLVKRVKVNEEAIAAIDAYRRNMNRDLLQLREQIQQQGQKRSTAPATAPGQP